jgi:Mediator complex subunit 25 von Willebrand factor type A
MEVCSAEPAGAAATIEDTGTSSCAAPPLVRVILIVETTAAAASTWRTTRKWLDTILQCAAKDVASTASTADATLERQPGAGGSQYALIVYGTHDRSTPAPVQSSSWTGSLQTLYGWLDGLQFAGGLAGKGTALAAALAEAIVLSKCPYPPRAVTLFYYACGQIYFIFMFFQISTLKLYHCSISLPSCDVARSSAHP